MVFYIITKFIGGKMELYKTLKGISSKVAKIATIGVIASLPYICESCSFSGITTNYREIKTQVMPQIEKENLETFIRG